MIDNALTSSPLILDDQFFADCEQAVPPSSDLSWLVILLIAGIICLSIYFCWLLSARALDAFGTFAFPPRLRY